MVTLEKAKMLMNMVMVATWGDYSNQGRELAYGALCDAIDEVEAAKRPGKKLMTKLTIAYEDLLETVKNDRRVFA